MFSIVTILELVFCSDYFIPWNDRIPLMLGSGERTQCTLGFTAEFLTPYAISGCITTFVILITESKLKKLTNYARRTISDVFNHKPSAGLYSHPHQELYLISKYQQGEGITYPPLS